MIYVVGSGPAGIACAVGLLDQGLTVTMLDYGNVLEDSIQRVVQQFSSQDPSDWEGHLKAKLKNAVGRRGVEKKQVFGSNFSYKVPVESDDFEAVQCGLRPSFARGGLSTVWGAAMLPYTADDISEWPISVQDLAPSYRRILEFIPFSAVEDRLATLFPLYAVPSEIDPSTQARSLISDWESVQMELAERGVVCGRSRLAVYPGCRHCGHCLHGCPYGKIYSAADSISQLTHTGRFFYRSGIYIEHLYESGDDVVLVGKTKEMGRVQFEGNRVYLACGAIETTRILLKSMGSYHHKLEMKDSQYFLMPVLKKSVGHGNIRSESLHTLAQLFIEIFDQDIDPKGIHLQVYGYNDLFDFIPVEFLLRRMLVIQGYLHSNSSSVMDVQLEQTESGRDRLSISGRIDHNSRRKIQQIEKKLRKLHRLTGLVPVPFLTQIQEPGRGFHSGGTFPMRAVPGPYESDLQGVPYGFKRVHAVDSTVFPSIPATTITLSVMANAHRIALGYYQ